MKFRSTPQSVEKSEVSILAIAETLFAMTISLYIALRYDTILHIAISGLLAPFLLLRTENSINLGLKWGGEWLYANFAWLKPLDGRLEKYTYSKLGDELPAHLSRSFFIILRLLLFTFFVFMQAVTFLVVRISAIISALMTHFFQSLLAIPGNWFQIVLVTDSFHYPEVLPGIDNKSSDLSNKFSSYRLSSIVENVRESLHREDESPEKRLAGYTSAILLVFAAIILFPPSFFYRLSIKSTAIIWLPLIWVVGRVKSFGKDASEKLKTIKIDTLEKIRQGWSVFILFFSFAMILFYSKSAHINGYLQQNLPGAILEMSKIYIFTFQIESWHIARFINAGITILIFVWACKHHTRSIQDEPPPGKFADSVLTGSLFIRNLFGLYVGLCALGIVYANIEIPPIGDRIFPDSVWRILEAFKNAAMSMFN